ncbi:MAG TPA: YicC family protein [bacterium]|nr:YicC family protein [bacterium]HPR88579.1 YicC family protein [bacterium]
MISSMTGFGRATHRLGDIEVLAEIRSVNNRFLDFSLRIPRILADYESQIKELVGKSLSRGRINIAITVASENSNVQQLALNKPLAASYYRLVRELQQELGLSGEVQLNQLLSLPDIIVVDDRTHEAERYWECTRGALVKVLEGIQQMRRQEGEQLLKDFVQRIATLDDKITRVSELGAQRPAAEMEKLRQRIAQLVKESRPDEGRLESELALIADRLDITEECVRFHSHNKAFLNILETEAAPGRKLNFLLQEMHREVNTIGSKAASIDISHLVVEIKDEVEKLREQIQNIE